MDVLHFTSGQNRAEALPRAMYTVETVSEQEICTLTIKNIAPDVAATYYCASWDSHGSRNPAITLTNTPSEAQPQTI